MEAGYDYLLFRRRMQRRFFNSSGIFIIVLGASLLMSSGGYYAYAAAARGNLQDLNALGQARPQADLILAEPDKQTDPAESMFYAGAVDVLGEEGLDLQAVGSAGMVSQRSMTIPASAISDQKLYPGEVINTGAWSAPAAYEPLSYIEDMQLQGFTPAAMGETLPDQAYATRIIIPSIGVDSTVKELAILDLAGSRSYETPANTVGHIPQTANAGEADSAWFFGHTESPLSGEGSVFYNLTQIPGKLNQGEDVFIVTENGQNRFLYRVTSTNVVHQSELELFESGRATIHLVSCVPRLVYDYRLVVNGELVGRN